LRRADEAEDDLEAKLEEACSNRNAAVSFFGVAIPKPKSLAKNNNSTSTSTTAAKGKDDGTFKPEEITEDMIFGNDIVTGGDDAQMSQEAET